MSLALYPSRVRSNEILGITLCEVTTQLQELVMPSEIDAFTLIFCESMSGTRKKSK
jgi:hypothetical protein